MSMWLFSLSALLSTLAMASPSPNKFGEVARYLPEFHAPKGAFSSQNFFGFGYCLATVALSFVFGN